MRVPTISYSSDRILVRCEQRYSYKFDQRLKPRLKPKGLYKGAWGHELLEAHYTGKDWEKKFKKLKQEKWDKLFDEEKEDYGENFPSEMHDLFAHYVEHWGPQEKKWKILHIETKFQLMTKMDIPLVWIGDLIVQEGKSTLLVESKFKEKLPDSDERILNVQPHSYSFLSKQKGIKIDAILWNYIRTTQVPRPQILKSGELSKRQIQTDQRSYLAAMKEAKIHPKGDEVIGLENYLKTLPETLSLLRVTNKPNLEVGKQFVTDWIERARRARDIEKPTRHFVRSCRWECEFFKLCQADLIKDVDRNSIIKKDFIRLGDIKNAGD